MSDGPPTGPSPHHPRLIQLLRQVDAQVSRRFGRPCRVTFGRRVEGNTPSGQALWLARTADASLTASLDGTTIRLDDPRLLAPPLSGLLVDLRRRLDRYHRLELNLGRPDDPAPERFILRLHPRAGREPRVTLHFPEDEPDRCGSSDDQPALQLYAQRLQEQGPALSEHLDALDADWPVAVDALELLVENVFTDGDRVTRREFKVMLVPGCNQRCLFCCARGSGRPASAERIQLICADLKARHAAELDQVVLALSGGEPTIHPAFESILAALGQLGFPHLALQTNGVALSRPALARAVHDAGVELITFSLHASTAALYDQLTATRDQFPLMIKAVEELGRYPVARIEFNIVLNRLNLQTLGEHLNFVAGLPLHAETRRAVVPSIIYMDEDNGNYESLALPYAEVTAALGEAIDRHPDLLTRLDGDCFMPVCAYAHDPRLAALIPEARADSPTAYLDRDQPAAGEVPAGLRVKHSRCKTCPFDARCGGLCGAHARRFGLAELKPIN